MKKLVAIALIIMAPAVVLADTYRATYTDAGGIYVAPVLSNVQKNTSPWTAGNLAFSNASSATAGDRPGAVLVTLSNVTSAGDYIVFAKDSQGTWHTLELRHEPLDNYKADVSALARTDRMNNGFSNISTHGDRSWTTGGAADLTSLTSRVNQAFGNTSSALDGISNKTDKLPDYW